MKFSAYDRECLAAAKVLVDKDISRHYTISELAKKVGIGSTKLKTGFKEIYGTGIYEYLKSKRMKTALQLLQETDKTLKQIARTTGFKHANNFITTFKKFHGTSPGKIRKNSFPE